MRALLNIDVPDLLAAEAFYRDAFGLRTGRRLGVGVIEMLGTGVPVYLLHKPEGSAGANAQPRTYARHWCPLHCDVVVDDLDTATARALAAGATREGPSRDERWGRIAQLADPFGHGWCLIQFSAAGYDAILNTIHDAIAT